MKTVTAGRPPQVGTWMLLTVALVTLLMSPRLAYWVFELKAPQYPAGLILRGYPDRIVGDVSEIDLLNHYIGMRELGKAAQWERRLALPAIGVMAAGLLVAAFWRSRWSVLLLIPVVVFPFVFLLDLQMWLRDYGLNLDRRAPLSSSVKPFVPRALGSSKIANFKTYGYVGPGFYLAATASAASLVTCGIRLRHGRSRRIETVSEPSSPALRVALAVPILLTLGGPSTVKGATLIVKAEGPIETIAEALELASSGDTIIVEGGHHKGPLKVDKSIRLIGRQGAVIAGPGTGTVVTVVAPDVHFSGFTIRGSGDVLSREDSGLLVTATGAVIEDNRFEDVLFGVSLQRATGSVVRGNTMSSKPLPLPRRGDLIRVWYSDDVSIERNHTQGGRDIVLWFSKRISVRDNEVRDGRYGLHFMYCHDATVESNRLLGNSVGAFLMYSHSLSLRCNWLERNRGASGHGIGLKDMESARIIENVMIGNRVGIFAENSRGEFERNVVAHNETGLSILPSARGNLFRDNSFIENGEQVSIAGLSGTMTTNRWSSNYWSDYRGFDGDGDGLGDQPYRPSRLFERLADRNSSLRLFVGNPSTSAIDFASQVFPVFQPRPKFVDSTPRMRPVPPPVLARRASRPLPWLGLAFAMFAWPTALLAITSRRPPSVKRRQASVEPSTTIPIVGDKSQPAIAVSGLTKRFRKVTAVDDLTFHVDHGEVVVLWGLNGAGKSTVLRCLLGLIPFEGTAHVHSLPCCRTGKEARRLLGYVPQEVRLHADQTVLQAVEFYARLRRVDLGGARQLLADWGLKEAEHRAVGHLSGGMKQKLALVLALLSDPPVLLLDEPTSNLDAQSRHEFAKLLQQLKQAGKTLVFCSHRASEIGRLADRVIVLKEGRKVAEGPPVELGRYLKRAALLSLTIEAEHCAAAAAILRDAGFRVEADGAHLLVDVPAGRKVEPFRLLTSHQLPIVDFELDDERSDDVGEER